MFFRVFFIIQAVITAIAAFVEASPLPRADTLAGKSGFSQYLIKTENIPSPTLARTSSILRDRQGFLWFGTTHGLHKYDGYTVRVFEFPIMRSVGPFVTAILENGDSSLLLASWQGLWKFSTATEEFMPFLENLQLKDKRIDALVEDAHHRLWIGSRTSGLYSYDRTSGEGRLFTVREGLTDNGIVCLYVDHEGTVWIGTHFGVTALDPSTGRATQYHSRPGDFFSLSSDEVRTICEDGSGRILIGTLNGLNQLDRSTGRIKRYLNSRDEVTEIRAVCRDQEGNLWVSVWGGPLYVWKDGALSQIMASSSAGGALSDPFIHSMYVDPTSTATNILIWIGARGGGVDKVRMIRNPFSVHTRGQDLPIRGNGAVLSVCEDRDGLLWVGLWGGGINVLRKENGHYELIAHFVNDPNDPLSLPNNDVNSIIQDSKGRHWIGTSNGLAMLPRGGTKFEVHRHNTMDSSSLPSNIVGKIYEDHTGTLWFCTDGGLTMLAQDAPMKFENYLNRVGDGLFLNGAYRNEVSSILEDRQGDVWVSMYGGGLNKIRREGGYIRHLNPTDSSRLEQNWVFAIHEGRDGSIWISSAVGLSRFNPALETFTEYPVNEMHDAHIFGIEDDVSERVYLSTGIGLVHIEPSTGIVKRYDESDGLSMNEFFSEFSRSTHGTLLVGGLDGIIEFDPRELQTHNVIPNIVITGFSVFDKIMSATAFSSKIIRLTYDQNYFSFSFAALDYSSKRQNRYRFRMSGVDPDWVDAGNRNYAAYTNVDPGTYLFEVRGSSSDGVWNEAGTSITIEIEPPYWQTWWFRSLAGALVISALYVLYRYRMTKIVEMERLRLRIADDLHDDVGSNLSSIAMISRLAQRIPDVPSELKKRLSDIYETALVTSEGMKDIVWFIKPSNDTVGDFVLRMRDAAASILASTEHSFHSSAEHGMTHLSIDFKRNCFLAFKEILTNIVKHAKATKVDITVQQRDDRFELTVRDNGKGFDEHAIRYGNGLQSLQHRARSLNGTCRVVSRAAEGTTVIFAVQL